MMIGIIEERTPTKEYFQIFPSPSALPAAAKTNPARPENVLLFDKDALSILLLKISILTDRRYFLTQNTRGSLFQTCGSMAFCMS